MQSTAASVDEYMATVPAQRQAALARLRELCREQLDGYEEGMKYGMPTYSCNDVVEVGFMSQKNYIALYIANLAVMNRHRAQLPDCGKGCIRYRKPEQLDFDLIGQLLAETADSSTAL